MESQPSLSQLSQDSLVPTTELSRPPTPILPFTSSPGSPGPSDQAKFTSPPPPTASMTPPPSSQIPNTRVIARTPTPPTPQLTSPPPSARLFNQASSLVDSAPVLYTPDQISNASAEELRAIVTDLSAAFRDVRLSAAHYKLQYNMAVMESQEAASRMAVELAMAQREIDVLQQAEEKRRDAMASPVQAFRESTVERANAVVISELNRTCQLLQSENDELRDQLDEQNSLVEHKQGEIISLREENDRLKTRIRKNRDHIAPFLPYMDQMSEQGSPRSLLGTPHQSTPRHRGHRGPPHLQTEARRGQSNFEALLLADKMLSQETATAPSTPTRSHGPRSRFGHNRGTHSMSSLPHTPNRRSIQHQPRTPPTFSAVNVPQSAPAAHYQAKPVHTRRESSNSTITASSVDEEEAFTEREDEDVPESQASQMATSMLRRAAPAPKQMQAPLSSSQLVQSKIFGHVKKGGSYLRRSGETEKRRLPSSAEHHSSPTKRGRIDQTIGLGIGGILRD